MKRIAWLVLLVSLGLNLGLGWRLMGELRNDGADYGEAEGRTGRGGRSAGQGRGHSDGTGKGDSFRPAPGDSGAWRQVMDRRLERVARRLELDPAQVETFQSTHRQAASRFRSQRLQVAEAESRLSELVSSSPVQPDSIRAAVRELGRRKARLDSLVTETMLRELDSLNPDQQQLYLRILPWSQSRGGEQGHRGRGRHRQPEPPDDVQGE